MKNIDIYDPEIRPSHRDEETPTWKTSLENSNLQPSEKKLLTYFVEQVLEGPADLRTYAFESFLDFCTASGYDSLSLQQKLMRLLLPREVQRLALQVPKGCVVTITSTLHYDGSSPAETQFLNQLVKAHGLHVTDESGTQRQISKKQQSIFFAENLRTDEVVFEDVQTGVVVAEPVQGYSYGIRVRDDSGQDVDCQYEDITSFTISGVDKSQSYRREREIYPGKTIQIWDVDLQCWIKGVITERILGDTIRVIFEKPLEKLIEGSPETIWYEDVWVGNVSMRTPHKELPGSNLPELGSSQLEQKPYLFESIDLTGESTSNPYESVPEEFRPGAVILFPNGTLGLVGRSSTQGFVEILGVDSKIKPQLHAVTEMNWINLPDNQMPTLLRELPQLSLPLKGKTIEISESMLEHQPLSNRSGLLLKIRSFLSKNSPQLVSMVIKGVYEIGDRQFVVLECSREQYMKRNNRIDQSYYYIQLDELSISSP